MRIDHEGVGVGQALAAPPLAVTREGLNVAPLHRVPLSKGCDQFQEKSRKVKLRGSLPRLCFLQQRWCVCIYCVSGWMYILAAPGLAARPYLHCTTRGSGPCQCATESCFDYSASRTRGSEDNDLPGHHHVFVLAPKTSVSCLSYLERGRRPESKQGLHHRHITHGWGELGKQIKCP